MDKKVEEVIRSVCSKETLEYIDNQISQVYGDNPSNDSELESLFLAIKPLIEVSGLLSIAMLTGNKNKIIGAIALSITIDNIFLDFARKKGIFDELIDCSDRYAKYFENIINSDIEIEDFAEITASEVVKITNSLITDIQ